MFIVILTMLLGAIKKRAPHLRFRLNMSSILSLGGNRGNRWIKMRKYVLTLLLAVVSSSAIAEWVLIEVDEKQKAYADPASIHKIVKDDKSVMWSMIGRASRHSLTTRRRSGK
jgi:hypothetical protein